MAKPNQLLKIAPVALRYGECVVDIQSLHFVSHPPGIQYIKLPCIFELALIQIPDLVLVIYFNVLCYFRGTSSS